MYGMYSKVTLKLPFVTLVHPCVEYSILGIDEPQYFVPLICLHLNIQKQYNTTSVGDKCKTNILLQTPT